MRVLVADDEPTSRLLAKRAVERLGHECAVAADGTAAWQLLQEHPVDVLITDWMMPGIDGPELCRRVRARNDDDYTYILIMTSLDTDTDVVTGMQSGADDYLIKPLDPFSLQTRLIAAQRVTELHQQLAQAKAALANLARTDPLTQLNNRLRLHEDLTAVHERARRSGRPYSIAICDVDKFKDYNDTYGHLQGDDALRRVAHTIRQRIRAADAAYRYGGEEFLILLPDTATPGAITAMEHLRQNIQHLNITHPTTATVALTVSIGIATWQPTSNLNPTQILESADAALYTAKQGGRNQTATAQSQPQPTHI
jgi:diguanylate cyclase (GGDEF)-like protein